AKERSSWRRRRWTTPPGKASCWREEHERGCRGGAPARNRCCAHGGEADMSVLLGRDTRVLVQGMGREGTFHAMRMREYGTKVVGGVVRGAGGRTREGFPTFDTGSSATGQS